MFSVNFGTGYTNGDLVGQNGWSQTGTTTQTVFQTVNDGAVVLPAATAGQDTWKAFSSTVDTKVNGNYLLTKINFTVTNAVSITGDYFFHLSSPAGFTTSNGF